METSIRFDRTRNRIHEPESKQGIHWKIMTFESDFSLPQNETEKKHDKKLKDGQVNIIYWTAFWLIPDTESPILVGHIGLLLVSNIKRINQKTVLSLTRGEGCQLKADHVNF